MTATQVSHYKPGPGCGGGNVAGSLRGVKNGRLLLAPPTAVISGLICSHHYRASHHEVRTSAKPPWCHILTPLEPNPLFFIKLRSLEYYIIAMENRLRHSDSQEVLVRVEP